MNYISLQPITQQAVSLYGVYNARMSSASPRCVIGQAACRQRREQPCVWHAIKEILSAFRGGLRLLGPYAGERAVSGYERAVYMYGLVGPYTGPVHPPECIVCGAASPQHCRVQPRESWMEEHRKSMWWSDAQRDDYCNRATKFIVQYYVVLHSPVLCSSPVDSFGNRYCCGAGQSNFQERRQKIPPPLRHSVGRRLSGREA